MRSGLSMKIQLPNRNTLARAMFAAIIVTILFSIFRVDAFLIITTIVWIFAMVLLFADPQKNIFFIIFMFSFFIFLLSGDIVEALFGRSYYIKFDMDAIRHSHICTLIAVVFLFFGFLFSQNRNVNQLEIINNVSDRFSSIKYVSRVIFYLTYWILLADGIYKVFYVLANGYVAYYYSYNSFIPNIVLQIGDFCPIALCSFLATFPTKKEVKLPLMLYFIYTLTFLFMGQRGGIVYNLCFIFGYLYYRNSHYSYGETWIKKRTVVLICCLIPVALVGLQLITYLRAETVAIVNKNFFDNLIDFFVNIGSSSTVIKYGYEYNDSITSFRFFSMGDLLNYFKYSNLFTWFTGVKPVSIHSAEYAMQGHSFDAFISYMFMRTAYLNGEGSGSSFVAELFADFGYIGIAAGSLIYGTVFKKISNFDNTKWLTSTLKLYCLLFFFKTPRGSYSAPFACIINITFWLVIAMIYFLSQNLSAKIKD